MDLLVAVTEAAEALATTEQPAASAGAVLHGAEVGEAACLVLRRLGPVSDGVAYLAAAEAFAGIRLALDDAAVGYDPAAAPVLPPLQCRPADVYLTESALAGLASDLSITVGLLACRSSQAKAAVAAIRAVDSAVRARRILTRREPDDDLR